MTEPDDDAVALATPDDDIPEDDAAEPRDAGVDNPPQEIR